MHCLTVPLAALAAFCATHSAATEVPSPAPPAEEEAVRESATAETDGPLRMCFGGYEDGKVIVTQGRIQDAALETTAQACRIDGGSDARAPQSPLLAARRFAVLV